MSRPLTDHERDVLQAVADGRVTASWRLNDLPLLLVDGEVPPVGWRPALLRLEDGHRLRVPLVYERRQSGVVEVTTAGRIALSAPPTDEPTRRGSRVRDADGIVWHRGSVWWVSYDSRGPGGKWRWSDLKAERAPLTELDPS